MISVVVDLREAAVCAVRAGRPLTVPELIRAGVPPASATGMALASQDLETVDDALGFATLWAARLTENINRPAKPRRNRKAPSWL